MWANSLYVNIWPAAQTSPGPLGGAWIGWEWRKDVVGLWWKCGSSPTQMYVTVGRDRLCLILWHVVMPPIARGQTWLFQPLPVSTVPNTGRNQSDSGYRGLGEEEQQKSNHESKLASECDQSIAVWSAIAQRKAQGQPYKGMVMGNAPELERTLLKMFFIVFFLLPSGRLSAGPSIRSESSSAHSAAAARI